MKRIFTLLVAAVLTGVLGLRAAQGAAPRPTPTQMDSTQPETKTAAPKPETKIKKAKPAKKIKKARTAS